jgi:His/Glu/Gln/Arg/opine family amino acid ABC transporter permease subunit
MSFVGACLLGFLWEVLRRSHRVARPVVQFWIDAIRSTPILVQIYFLFYVLPQFDVVLPAMVVGVFGLSFYYSGYISEVYKAGIDAIPRGQTEAAQSLGLDWLHTIWLVIAPQMLRNVAAPLGSYSVSILKATPYLAAIAVPEILGSIDVQGLQILRQAAQPDIVDFGDRAAEVVVVDTTDLQFFEGKAFHVSGFAMRMSSGEFGQAATVSRMIIKAARSHFMTTSPR